MQASETKSAEYKRNRPYKFLGYPELCRYIASDNDLFLFRRFGELNARILLTLQHEIEDEEAKLKALDRACAEDENQKALLNSLRWDKHEKNPYPERIAIVHKLQALLHTYSMSNKFSGIQVLKALDEHLVTYSQLREKESARDYQVENIRTWIRNRSNPVAKNSGPIRDEEQAYLETGVDLIGPNTRPKRPISRWLERRAVVQWLCRKSTKRGQVQDQKTIYYSDEQVEWLSNIVTILLGLCMLYGPTWWLNYVYNDAKRLAIITVFVFLFAIGLSLVGSGRPFETLAATAAYAAVLMVFLQRQADSVNKT